MSVLGNRNYPFHDAEGQQIATGIEEITGDLALTNDGQKELMISSKSSLKDQGKNGEDKTHQQEENVNNSLALVPIDLPKPKENSDPVVSGDTTVREVLNALRHAKEKLQSHMERRSMIKVG
ncbi:hypothetical protein A4A49_52690 [Nicotiana attenuata]|uniref:Uncharacterized protein n=1 Tax=Nicotiana attenuata TaxID=49451 RepID=A0A314LAV9_NICAT|nr:hypothetical protein A4A49_52690 [Nicotiana attenuata]